MDRLKEREDLLAILMAAAILACGCLWGIQLSQGGASPVECLGLLCTVAAAILLAVRSSAQRRRLTDLEHAHQEELAELEQLHHHSRMLSELHGAQVSTMMCKCSHQSLPMT